MKNIVSYLSTVLLLILLLPHLTVAGDTENHRQEGDNCHAELVRVSDKNLAELRIDDDFPSTLQTALQESIRSLGRQPPRASRLPGLLSPQRLRESLQALLSLVREDLSKQEFLQRLRRDFDFFTYADDAAAQPLLITGYYEPEYQASLIRIKPYLYPLYSVPDDLVTSERCGTGKKRVFRRKDNMLYTYWSRREIETESLLAGRELVYLADPLAAFILHIQGSGRLRLTDGALRRVRYAGNNGLPYKSIGRLLVEKGVIALEQASLPAIIKYLRAHPDELRQILNYNERYIFFSWDERSQGLQLGPVGSMGAALVPGRSVALDPRYYPPGLVGFLNTSQPRFDEKGRLFSWVRMHRLVVGQDSGAAITGPFRLDLFYGHGPYAERAAGVMRQRGDFYILLKKTLAEPPAK